MKVKNAIIAASFTILAMANTHAAQRVSEETVTKMTATVCKEIAPIVADALAEAYKGKDKRQIAEYVTNRGLKDKSAGKRYPDVLVPEAWGRSAAEMVTKFAADIKKMYPNQPETYAKTVEDIRKSFHVDCVNDYRGMVKNAYDLDLIR